MNNYEWLEKAINKIEGLTTGSEFEVKNLFEGVEWFKLDAKERQGFGRFFSNAYKDGKLESIERVILDKKGANKYRKI